MAQLYSSQPSAPPTPSLCSLGPLSLLAHPACLAWNAPNTFSNFQYPIWGSGTSLQRKGRPERKAAGSSLHSDTDLPPRYMLLGKKIHDKVQNASIWVKNRKEKLEILWLNTYVHTLFHAEGKWVTRDKVMRKDICCFYVFGILNHKNIFQKTKCLVKWKKTQNSVHTVPMWEGNRLDIYTCMYKIFMEG